MPRLKALVPCLLLVLIVSQTAARAQTIPPGPFQEVLQELVEKAQSLDGVVSPEDLGQLFSLISATAFLINQPEGTPIVQQKAADLMACAILELLSEYFLSLTAEEQEIFFEMLELTQQIQAQAFLVDSVRTLLPSLPSLQNPKPKLCVLDLLTQEGNLFTRPGFEGVRISSPASAIAMKAVARDESGNEIDGTFTWSTRPAKSTEHIKVTPLGVGSRFAQLTVLENAPLFPVVYEVEVEFNDGERLCRASLRVTARNLLPLIGVS